MVARATNFLLRKRQGEHFSRALPRQLILLAIVLLETLVAVLVMLIGDPSRKGIFSLLSIGLTAMVAISSTTLVSNAMAGIMLRAVKSFHDGDFIRAKGAPAAAYTARARTCSAAEGVRDSPARAGGSIEGSKARGRR